MVTCDSRQEELAPVAVLFSGGLDSMILAALLDECLDHSCKCFYQAKFFFLNFALVSIIL